jgi:predicted dehydrogenase
VKVAVVGLGYWGPNLLRNLVALIGGDRVVAVDHAPERLAAACAQYPSVTGLTSLEEALAQEEVTAVVLATPVSTHGPMARRCLELGRHVLVEKPLAKQPAEAAALVILADQRNLVLMAGHTFLFSPRVERMVEYLRRGGLGQVQYVTSARLNLGLHQKDVGVIWDLGAHDFSILFHLLNEYPVAVQTSGRGVVRPRTLDVAFMNLTFASGVVASVTVSWLSPRKVRNTIVVGDHQMLAYDDLDNEEPVKIYDKGVVMPDPENFGEHQLTYRHGDVLVPYVPVREPLALELAHFLACVEGTETCRSDGRFGLRVVEALEAAERSWQDGGRVTAIEPCLAAPSAAAGTIP